MPKHLTETVDASITADLTFTTGACKVSPGGSFQVDVVAEYTAATGVTVDGVLLKDSEVTCDVLNTDAITEDTLGSGVTITADVKLAAVGQTYITLSPSSALVEVGRDDITYGELRLYGDDTGSTNGGLLYLYLAADHDAAIVRYVVQPVSDDLYIGPSTDTDALKLTAEKDLHITAGALYITTAAAGVTVGTGQVLTTRQTGVSAMTNVTAPSNVDADTVTTAELADIVGTLIVKLRAHGLVGD